jgi:hypothetical protein
MSASQRRQGPSGAVRTGHRVGRRLAILAVAFVAAVEGCAMLPAATLTPVEQLPVGQEQVVPDALMRLQMANGTTIAVVLSVNGGVGRLFPPGGQADLGIAEIGPPPWEATVRIQGGRILLQLVVHPGDVTRVNDGNGASSGRGAGRRVDLSCGRIDLWSGVPPLGPAPGPGEPGDCDP